MNRWKRLAITTEEEEVVGLDDEDMAKGREEIGHGLLGRLFTRRPFNRKAFRDVISFLWDVQGEFKITEMNQGFFFFLLGT